MILDSRETIVLHMVLGLVLVLLVSVIKDVFESSISEKKWSRIACGRRETYG